MLLHVIQMSGPLLQGGHEGSAQRKPQGPARLGWVAGMHAAAPVDLWAAWDGCTCAGATQLTIFLSELRVLASLLLRVCALGSPLRSRKPAFTTGGGSALQRRGPGPGLLWSRRTARFPHDAVWEVWTQAFLLRF